MVWENELKKQAPQGASPSLNVTDVRSNLGRRSSGQFGELTDNIVSLVSQARTSPSEQRELLGKIRRLIKEAGIPEV